MKVNDPFVAVSQVAMHSVPVVVCFEIVMSHDCKPEGVLLLAPSIIALSEDAVTLRSAVAQVLFDMP